MRTELYGCSANEGKNIICYMTSTKKDGFYMASCNLLGPQEILQLQIMCNFPLSLSQ